MGLEKRKMQPSMQKVRARARCKISQEQQCHLQTLAIRGMHGSFPPPARPLYSRCCCQKSFSTKRFASERASERQLDRAATFAHNDGFRISSHAAWKVGKERKKERERESGESGERKKERERTRASLGANVQASGERERAATSLR